jgi:hypothetical protein
VSSFLKWDPKSRNGTKLLPLPPALGGSNFVIQSECCRGREGPHLRKIRAIHSDGQHRARRIEALQERRQAVTESAGTSFWSGPFSWPATITR